MPALSLPGLASRLDCLALPSNRLLYQDVVRFEGLTEQNGRDHMKKWNSGLSHGAGLMLIASWRSSVTRWCSFSGTLRAAALNWV